MWPQTPIPLALQNGRSAAATSWRQDPLLLQIC